MTSLGEQWRVRLIETVRRYPALYDTRHEHHKEPAARDACWAQIARELGQNGNVLKREWKILRDSLRQAARNTKKGGGSPRSRWKYYYKMAYILPFMAPRKLRARAHFEKPSTADDVPSEPEAVEEINDAPEALNGGQADDDGLELFFASVCQSTRRLPTRLQRSVKRKVLDALLDAERECEEDFPRGSMAKVEFNGE